MSHIRLESLYLDNFKSFKNSKFEFGDLNCLIAPNNTGKSNLIEALEFLDTLIYENPARAIAKIGFQNLKNYHYDEKEIYLNAGFKIENRVLIGNEIIDYIVQLTFVFELDFDTKKSNIDIMATGKIKNILIDSGNIVDGFEIIRVYKNFEKYISNDSYYLETLSKKRYEPFHFGYSTTTLRYSLNTKKLSTEDIIKNLFALQVTKDDGSLLKPIDLKLIFNRNSLFSSHYFHAHDIKGVQNLGYDYFLENGTNLAEYLSNLDKEVFEDISTSLIGEVELINSFEIKDGFTTDIVFNEEVNGKIYPIKLQKVSDGTIHFVAIMSALIGNKHSIGMMIEEPERHMHMKVLSCILNTMRNDDKQIFFTTHSTEMLSELELDEIIFMFRDFNGDTKGIRAKEIKNIKKIMKIYKNDIVEMIKIGILDGLEDELL
ncbi:MAG: AAA family ATPase [Campylobacterales bacterium]|nr:AAA family ATPase [Campylobacterales bacterium]